MLKKCVLVVESFQIHGRGLVVLVDASGVPVGGLRIGCLVHQGERAWTIVGIESAVGLSVSPRVGLVLRPEAGAEHPAPGSELWL